MKTLLSADPADERLVAEYDQLREKCGVAVAERRYRETVLALGGSESAFDVFREFRSRAPTTDALLRQQGLKPNTVIS